MVDLTACKEVINTFGGSEAKKRILYNNRYYMVKFPDPVRQKNNQLSYMNNQFSEDIGCKIFKSVGITTQNTFLATYTTKAGVQKIVVACEDFTQDGDRLIEFHKLSLMHIESSSLRSRANIDNVMEVIESAENIVDKAAFKNRFWEMFIIDGLIGNRDRNLDNWGVLEDSKGCLSFAPIYDCGSSLSPLLTEEKMEYGLMHWNVLKRDEFNVYSCFRADRNRILFSDYMKEPPEALSLAIKNIVPKVNMNKIFEIIESAPISYVHKHYLETTLRLRYDTILLPALNKQRGMTRELSRGR